MWGDYVGSQYCKVELREYDSRKMAKLTHLNDAGEAHMVDVSSKDVTDRVAVAEATLEMAQTTSSLIRSGEVAKGDVFAVARVAGIQAAKRTSDLIPLCHPLPLTQVSIDFSWLDDCHLVVSARCKVDGKTGVEMEALTAASISSLTIYDMCKAVDRGMKIVSVQLQHKSGGKSATWDRL